MGWWRRLRASAGADPETVAVPVSRERQHALTLGEMQRRIEGQERRMASAEARSNTLIASAAIFAGLLVVTPMSFGVLVALVINIAAAGFGIATIFPRAVPELDPPRMRQEILSRNPDDASLYLVDQYLRFIEDREEWIELKMRLIRAGLGLLGVSLIFAAVAISKTI